MFRMQKLVMRKIYSTILFFAFCFVLVFFGFSPTKSAHAQNEQAQTTADEPFDEGLFPEVPEPGAPAAEQPSPPVAPEEKIEGGAPKEGETRWNVKITGAVIMNYAFSNSPDSFTVKYRFEIKGDVNAAVAVIKGDVDINADVQGPLSKWPTGECRLEITIPKVPFELTFKKTSEDKSNLKLVFKRPVSEDWQSKCTFNDAPDAKFDTRGAPETWLSRALEKARPPLRDLIADLGTEETTTRFVINKDTISDPPLGNVEIEGTGVITIKSGGE